MAGLFLLATLAVGYVHNRWLHTTPLSWVGWSATFALLVFFVTYGGWGRDGRRFCAAHASSSCSARRWASACTS